MMTFFVAPKPFELLVHCTLSLSFFIYRPHIYGVSLSPSLGPADNEFYF